MRRLLLSFVVLAFVLSAQAQVPAASNPVCAECGGHEMAKRNGQWVELTPHKPGCPIAKKIAEAEAKAKENAWEPDFNSIEYQYGSSLTCPWCEYEYGLKKGHHRECPIGGDQERSRRAWDRARSPESVKSKIKRYEDNIRTLANDPVYKQPKTSDTQPTVKKPISTKLKDHQPMPEKKPAEPRPKIDPLASPELPNSIRMTNVRETSGPNDPTIYDKRIEFRGDHTEYYVVARCKTSQDGKEEWKLFKKDGEMVAGPFSRLYVTDQGSFNYFVAADLNGRWGIYNGYGEQKVMHRFDVIEPMKIRDAIGNLCITFKCNLDGKWGMLETYGPNNTPRLPFIYDDIREYSYDRSKIWIEKDGLYGLADWTGYFEVPLEYTYIENISYEKAGKYYIVSKDGVHYGAYHGNILRIPLEFSLGEARQKVRDDASEFIQRQNKRKRP